MNFLSVLWDHPDGQWCELRVPSLQGYQAWFPLQDGGVGRNALLRDAERIDALGHDTFIGVLPRLRARGRDEDCVDTTRILWADVDAKTHDASKAQALFALGYANLTPSILVDSGNGWHAYWILRDLVAFPQAESAMRGLAKAVGGDSVQNASRILRPVGTDNHKSEPPKPVRLLHFDPGRRYRFADFHEYIEEPRPRAFIEEGEWEPSPLDAPPFPEGQRNNSLTRLAGAMARKGLSEEEMVGRLFRENQIRCVPPLSEREVRAIVHSVQRYR